MLGTVYYTLNKENCEEIVEQSSMGREYLPRKLIWHTRKAPETSIRCLIAQFNQIAIF